MYKTVQTAFLVCFLTSFLMVQGSQQTIAELVPSPSEDSFVPGEMLVKYKTDSHILTTEYYQEEMGITTLKAKAVFPSSIPDAVFFVSLAP